MTKIYSTLGRKFNKKDLEEAQRMGLDIVSKAITCSSMIKQDYCKHNYSRFLAIYDYKCFIDSFIFFHLLVTGFCISFANFLPKLWAVHYFEDFPRLRISYFLNIWFNLCHSSNFLYHGLICRQSRSSNSCLFLNMNAIFSLHGFLFALYYWNLQIYCNYNR